MRHITATFWIVLEDRDLPTAVEFQVACRDDGSGWEIACRRHNGEQNHPIKWVSVLTWPTPKQGSDFDIRGSLTRCEQTAWLNWLLTRNLDAVVLHYDEPDQMTVTLSEACERQWQEDMEYAAATVAERQRELAEGR